MVASLTPTFAHADGAAGAALEREAEAFVATGDFLNAAARYRAAYGADPRPEFLCNVGVAYVKGNDPVRAHMYLSRCLERGSALDGQFTAQVRTVTSAVEQTLRDGDFTPIDIVVEPRGATIAIDGFAKDEAFVGSRVVWLPFGTHVITASLDGFATGSTTVVARSHTTTAATITLVKVATVATVATVDTTAPPRSPAHAPTRPSRVPPVIATAATVGAFVVSGLAYHAAHARAAISPFALTPAAYAADRDHVDAWNRVFVVTGAIGIAGAGVSGYLWWRALHTEAVVEVAPTTGGATLSVITTW